MFRDEIEPMVPNMPTETDSTTTVRADGGQKKRYDAVEVESPIIADLR